MIDGDLKINESRAICTYLVNKYGKGKLKQELYPEDDITLKAKIDQKFYFDMGTFYEVLKDDYVSTAATILYSIVIVDLRTYKHFTRKKG